MPSLRTRSVFRWTELLTQLNSLVNPLLYCFVLNRKSRSEVLKMLQKSPGQGSRTRRRMVNEDLNDIQELEEGHLETSGSCDSIMVNDACCQGPGGPMQEVSSSSSSTDAD